MMECHYVPQRNVVTFEKGTDTSFDMFAKYLIEQYKDEFADDTAITDEVKANLMMSKYKMGWPKELWMHEKSLSPSPQNLMYSDDDEDYKEQQRKMQLVKEQEAARRQRQLALIQERREERLLRLNRQVLPDEEANVLINTGTFLDNFRQKTKWIERTLGINTTTHNFFDDDGEDALLGAYGDVFGGDADDENKYMEQEDGNNNTQKLPSTSLSRRTSSSLRRKKMKNLLRFGNAFSVREVEGRAIGDINFSLTNPDWFLASYYTQQFKEAATSMVDETDGCILIWNMLLPRCPEYSLYSQSMITSTHFHPVDQFLVFAATTSGQILCYDLRDGGGAQSRKPVQRTSFSDGHSSGVFSMDFLQSGGNSKSDKRHILSISNDGKLCIWKDEALHEKPMHEGTLQLHDNTKFISFAETTLSEKLNSIVGADGGGGVAGDGVDEGGDDSKSNSMAMKTNVVSMATGGSSTSQELSTTCFGYKHKLADNLLFGSDSGKIYRTDIHSNSKVADDVILVDECVDAHFGPITNLDFPKYHSNTYSSSSSSSSSHNKISNYVSGLYLTSSYDWSVKLWHSEYTQCIETYTQMADYVYDVKWCTGGKPGVFACCDGEAKLTLFDLKYDFKEPISAPIQVPLSRGGGGGGGGGAKENNQNQNQTNTALTRLQWGNNGKYLATGDSDGTIYLYLASPKLLYPQQTDFDNLEKSVKTTIQSQSLK